MMLAKSAHARLSTTINRLASVLSIIPLPSSPSQSQAPVDDLVREETYPCRASTYGLIFLGSILTRLHDKIVVQLSDTPTRIR